LEYPPEHHIGDGWLKVKNVIPKIRAPRQPSRPAEVPDWGNFGNHPNDPLVIRHLGIAGILISREKRGKCYHQPDPVFATEPHKLLKERELMCKIGSDPRSRRIFLGRADRASELRARLTRSCGKAYLDNIGL